MAIDIRIAVKGLSSSPQPLDPIHRYDNDQATVTSNESQPPFVARLGVTILGLPGHTSVEITTNTEASIEIYPGASTSSDVEFEETGPVGTPKPKQPDPKWNTFLPSDVLTEIFNWAVDYRLRRARYSVSSEFRALLAFSHVCRFWRETAFENKSLWGQTMQVDRQNHSWFQQQLNRSEGAPLVIIADIPAIHPNANDQLIRQRELRANWEALFNQSARWSYFQVRIGPTSPWRPAGFSSVVSHPLPLLRHFNLFQLSDDVHELEDHGVAWGNIMDLSATLSTLQLGGHSFTPLLRDPAFIHGHSIPSHSLTRLSVHHFARAIPADLQPHFTASRWIEVLSKLRNLVYVSLFSAVLDDINAAPWQPVRPLRLPYLQTLKLVGHLVPITHLVSAIDIPPGCTFHLVGAPPHGMTEGELFLSFSRLMPCISQLELSEDEPFPDHWVVATQDSLQISARRQGERVPGFHIEVLLADGMSLIPDLTAFKKEFAPFLLRLCDHFSPAFASARTLTLHFDQLGDDPATIHLTQRFLSYFRGVEELQLHGFETPNLLPISAQVHSECSSWDGVRMEYLLPNLKKIGVGSSALRATLTGDDSDSFVTSHPLYLLTNQLLLRSCNPVARITDLVLFNDIPDVRNLGRSFDHDFDPTEDTSFSIEHDVEPYLEDLDSPFKPKVSLATDSKAVELFGLTPPPAVEFQVGAPLGAEFVPWRFDDADFLW